ncbi:exported hypothetical protein [Acidithiobacillus ferrivorans]|uniref:Uncharacterized protein n=1 Tax=Acidithiobacillus ferrivorans TaxID=160808 RepID=A0A060URQ9_9PROT|nr:exported hypothetical protein [Acidithiobacillus ferrivorans]
MVCKTSLLSVIQLGLCGYNHAHPMERESVRGLNFRENWDFLVFDVWYTHFYGSSAPVIARRHVTNFP